MTTSVDRFGFVAIVGRPNVGKSTLLNHFLGKKISITSRKPQTTRDRILGIKTIDDVQIAYVDTPGLHSDDRFSHHRHLNRAAQTMFQDVDMVLFVVDVKAWQKEDDWILGQLKLLAIPVILAVNKIDRMPDQAALLPYMDAVRTRFDFHRIVPISAKKGDQVSVLEQEIVACLPAGAHGYSPDQWTDRSDRFMASEILREKLMRMLGEELPYAVSVTIAALEEADGLMKISATIWVEKESQKAIVIGKKGAHLKEIATRARQSLETYFAKKVFLQTWVKVGLPKRDDETQ